MNGITITLSEDLKISIGKLDLESPHLLGRAESGRGDVAQDLRRRGGDGRHPYRATIDETGIRITGLPEDAAPVPQFVPQDVNQAFQVVLDQANVRIATANGTKTVEDVSSDASLSGLLITFTGTVPNVFIPDVVSQLVYEHFCRTCLKTFRDADEGRSASKETSSRFCRSSWPRTFPSLPLCFSPQVVPGPGSGTVTTFSIGSVRSLSAAVQAENFAEGPTDGAVDGGFVPEPPLSLGPPAVGGEVVPQPGGGVGTRTSAGPDRTGRASSVVGFARVRRSVPPTCDDPCDGTIVTEMAGDPEAVAPRGSSRRRFRRAVARGHLEVASPPAIEDASDEDRAAPAVSRAPVKAKRADGAARTFVRSNARVLAAAALLVAGIVIVLLGWYGAANTNILTEQVPYLISGGLLGMALIIVSAVVGSSASLERENRELRRDLTRLLSASGGRSRGGNRAAAPRGASDDGGSTRSPAGAASTSPAVRSSRGSKPRRCRCRKRRTQASPPASSAGPTESGSRRWRACFAPSCSVLANGSVYALAATGVVLIYKTTRILNLGYGALALFTTFIYWQFTVVWGWPLWCPHCS